MSKSKVKARDQVIERIQGMILIILLILIAIDRVESINKVGEKVEVTNFSAGDH